MRMEDNNTNKTDIRELRQQLNNDNVQSMKKSLLRKNKYSTFVGLLVCSNQHGINNTLQISHLTS